MTNPNTPRINPNDESALNTLLETYHVAPPSDLLAARILREAKVTTQDPPAEDLESQDLNTVANASRTKKYWPRIAALALVAFSVGMVSFTSLTPSTSEDETSWLEAANDLGMDEIYDWVENESPVSENAL